MANKCNKTFRDLINDGQAQVLGIVSIVPMGDWNATTTYQKLNYVRHNGATYLAKVASNNVEPGVAPNWKAVWMLCNYDGGLVVPDGTYPDLTAGQVLYPLSFGSKTYNGSSAQTVTAADLGVASAYIPQGSITFANLPSTPSAATLSYVWDISDQFTTDSRFIEGAGQTYSAGTNVGVIEQNGNYYYDVFGSFVDLSNYAQINGTYPNMTVGNATKAEQDGDGNSIADTYAKQSGSYPNMTVGNATKATQDGAGNNIAETYAKQNGSYQNLNVGYAMTAEVATQSTQDSLGNNIFDTYMGHWALNKTKDGTKQKDFNNYTEAGFYELFAGSADSWSNFPISNDNPSSINGNWFLLVLKRSDDYITQIAVSVRGDTAIAIRNCSGGTWGSWRIISQYIGGARKTLGLENVSSGTFTFYNQKTYTIRKDSNVSDWWFRIGMSGNIVTVGIQFNPSKQLTKGTRYRLAYGLPTNQQNESGFWAMMDDVGDAQGDFEIDMNGNLYFTSHNYNITTSTYLNGGAMYITGDVV